MYQTMVTTSNVMATNDVTHSCGTFKFISLNIIKSNLDSMFSVLDYKMPYTICLRVARSATRRARRYVHELPIIGRRGDVVPQHEGGYHPGDLARCVLVHGVPAAS